MRLKKQEFLEHWQGIEPNQPIRQDAVRYKHEGSTYGEDSIRLTGSPRFVDAVLSRLKDLLAGENGMTRVQVVYGEIEPRDDKPAPPEGSVACYIQTHERGHEAQIMAAKLAYWKEGRIGAAYTAQLEQA